MVRDQSVFCNNMLELNQLLALDLLVQASGVETAEELCLGIFDQSLDINKVAARMLVLTLVVELQRLVILKPYVIIQEDADILAVKVDCRGPRVGFLAAKKRAGGQQFEFKVLEVEDLEVDVVLLHVEGQEGQVVILHPEAVQDLELSLGLARYDARVEVILLFLVLRVKPDMLVMLSLFIELFSLKEPLNYLPERPLRGRCRRGVGEVKFLNCRLTLE